MKHFIILDKDLNKTYVKAEKSIDVIKKYDLATMKHIKTRVIEMETEEEANQALRGEILF